MNNKSETLNEFLLNNDKKHGRFDIKSLKGYSLDSKADRTCAKILSQLESFYIFLKAARIDIGIEPTLGVRHIIIEEHRITSNNIESIRPPLYPGAIKQLDKQAATILEEFNLTSNWRTSIRMLILIHTLYLPLKNTPVSLDKPKLKIKHVPIYITEQISISELCKEIRILKPQIIDNLSTLPKAPSTKIDDETIRWGRAIRLVGGVSAIISDKWLVEAKERLEELLPKEDVPEPIELRKYYERFLQYSIKRQKPVVMVVK